MRILLNGKWHVVLEDGTTGQMDLPGTLDENGIGHRDVGANQWHPDAVLGNAAGEIDKDAPIATRFTRRHTYEGEARISRKITVPDYGTDRLFVLAERARALRLLVDGEACAVFRQGTLSTPYIFELTGAAPGEHEFTFLSDNSYPGMPKAAICYSSAVTDETQTNWNGILGECSMYTRPQNFIDSLRVYPRAVKKEEKNKAGGYVLDVCVELAPGAKKVYKDAKIILQSEALAAGELEDTQTLTEIISCSGEGLTEAGTDKEENPKTMEIWFRDLPLRENVKLWDEDEGNLYEMAVTLDNGISAEDKGGSTAECRIRFGIRSFGDNGSGRLALNGRAIFLRGEANCAEYPETGHPPMLIPEWKEILLKYRSYGINCVRFHSHCEPEAAFTAADELGMLLQPELSNWESATITTLDDKIPQYIKKICKRDPFTGHTVTGGIVTVKDSSWLLSWTLNRQQQFRDQPKNQLCVWVYGLFSDKPGDYVKKPMRDCTGREICMEWLYHLGVPTEDIAELADHSANTVPVMMPYIDAFFMPRAFGDRPDIVPKGAVNFAFLGQFAETGRDTIFTTEYSMRTGMEAVYTLLDIDRGVPEVWGSTYDVRCLIDATVKLRDGKKLTDMDLPFIQRVALKEVLKKIEGTDLEKFLKEYNAI